MAHLRLVLLSLLCLFALGLLVWPQPPSEADHRAAQGAVVIDYWEKWSGREAEQMKQIVDDFNATVGKQKNIYVRYLSMSTVDQKTLIATAAGVPPDVAGLWDKQLQQFAALGALQPLDDLAAAAKPPITSDLYWPIYWDACHYHGHLYALISTPCDYALHYNKRIFYENADKLRAAGLDPTRAPRTLDELDRYARVLDRRSPGPNGQMEIDRSGYLPMEPGWALNLTCYWFGGDIFDSKTGQFTLTSPATVRAYDWIRSYAQRLGPKAVTDFRSGVGNFDSPQNAFMAGTVAMEQQGPWMANYIYMLNPKMSEALVPRALEPYLPRILRPFNYEWGVAPFPSAVTGLENVTWVAFDALVIPRGARHPREAFEFIAFVNRQDEMEKLCSMHCKNSPLRKVSDDFIRSHPNPYIDVFQQLAQSPNAHWLPEIGIWPEVDAELTNMAQEVYLQTGPPAQQPRTIDILRATQDRLQAEYDRFRLSQEISHRWGTDEHR